MTDSVIFAKYTGFSIGCAAQQSIAPVGDELARPTFLSAMYEFLTTGRASCNVVKLRWIKEYLPLVGEGGPLAVSMRKENMPVAYF